MNSKVLTFIITNWNTRDLTLRCIGSIYENVSAGFEIIVVDNHSADDSVVKIRERYPDVVVMVNNSNLGYAKANNQGIRAAKGDLIILMNSDAAILTKGPVQSIRQYLADHPLCGIIGARQEYPDGRVQSLGRSFVSVKSLFKNQILFRNSFKVSGDLPDRPFRTDYVDGAFLVIRASVIEHIGLLNENYFMYAEDMEWCASAWNAGWQVHVLPQIRILHEHAASSKQNFTAVLVHNAVNQCRFLYHMYGIHNAKVAFWILLAGMLLRIPLSVIRRNGLARDYYQGFMNCLRLQPGLVKILAGGGFETDCR